MKLTSAKRITIQFAFFFPLLLLQLSSAAQTASADLEFRFNPLYSRGFRVPLYAGDEPGFFTMQRTRLILNYENKDSLKAKVVFQDRRVWGEVSERADVPEVAIFRAWVEQRLAPNLSVKLGRQGLVYDDEHLLGELNWGGTLAHDVALTKYERKDLKVHLGLAFNANRINLLKNERYLPNFYKNMQFIWVHRENKRLSASFILINRGMQSVDTTSLTTLYTQTFGTNTSFKISDKISVKGIFYQQLGNDPSYRQVNANFWSAQLNLKPTKKLDLTLGVEVGSGTDQNKFSDVNRNQSSSFDRHYGLLHGHFGYLDYFYVAVFPVFGVQDYYVKMDYAFKERWKVRNNIHFFQTDAKAFDPSDTQFLNPLDRALGVENDFLLSYKVSKNFKASFGHSIMFGTPTLEAMFGGTPIVESQFFYMVITASPRLFKTNFD